MCFFDKKKSENENKNKNKNKVEATYDWKPRIDLLIEAVKKKTEIKSYRIEYTKAENIGIFESKLGGLPYWDREKEYPTDSRGEKLFLLAQINFEKERFDDERLPQNGILQFFIANDDLCGSDFDKKDRQSDWRVIYHENIDSTVTENIIRDELKIPTHKDADRNDYMLPFSDEYLLTFKAEPSYMYDGIVWFDDIAFDILRNDFHESIPSNAKLYGYLTPDEHEYLCDGLCRAGSRLLGHPFFVQDDRRWTDEMKFYDTLLLQIDSEQGIMWGDAGVANFFINGEQLKNKDFSRLMYTWDCG